MRCPLAVMAALLLSAPVHVPAQDQPAGRPARLVATLSVNGEANVFVQPDVAVVRLGVFAQEKDAAAAQSRVNEAMQKVVAAVKQQGVPAEQVQTSGLSLHPITTYPQPRPDQETPPEPRVVGYRADQTITVRLTELTRAGPVIDAGLAAGANTLQGISFELQDDTWAKAAALKRAVQSARAKARALAEALEVNLAYITEAAEGGAQIVQPMYDMAGMEAIRTAMPGTPIEPGQVQVFASVMLRYRMSGAGVAPAPDDDRPR